MTRYCAPWLLSAVCGWGLFALGARPTAAAESGLQVIEEPSRLVIRDGDNPVATYVFRDDRVPRPFFVDLFAPTGERVSRKFPPTDGEPTDHDTFHPGLALAFGDIDGADFWRNVGRIDHVEFVARPFASEGRISFTVRNDYRAGETTVCGEVCRHTLNKVPSGYLITYDSEFSGDRPFTFGDQEEMGLGVRLTAGLRVNGGKGTIVNSEGLVDERQVWGKTSKWCDLSGPLDGHWVGVLLMPHPDNFRPSWFHARDYGFAAANPFGRKAFTGGAASAVTVNPGETLRLRFGVVIHGSPKSADFSAEQTFKDYVHAAKPQAPAPAP